MNEAQATTTPAVVNPQEGSLAWEVARLVVGRVHRAHVLLGGACQAPLDYATLAKTLATVASDMHEAANHAAAVATALAQHAGASTEGEGEEGEGAPASPITDATRAAILELAAKGNKPPEIARALGLKGSRVRRVLKKAGVVVAAPAPAAVAPAAPAAAAPVPAAPVATNGKGAKKGGKAAKAGGPF